MSFIVHEIAPEAIGRVTIVPTDPRDGPVAHTPVAAGTAMQAALVLLSRCSLHDLHWLSLTGLRRIQAKVAGEERAAEALRRESRETGVVPAAEIQREFDAAIVEEQEFADGIWREDPGHEPGGPKGGQT